LRKKLVLAFALVLALAAAALLGVATSSAAEGAQEGAPRPKPDPGSRHVAAARAASYQAAVHWLAGQIHAYQHLTWRWQRLMRRPLTPTEGRELDTMSVPDVEQAVSLWQHRADAAEKQAQHPPHKRALLCIHRYEGSWSDGGAPYYGGLQMDWGFMRHYAPRLLRSKGTADHWSPLEQMWVAERALRTRGFQPWPNTARYCGLL
jgi:hypothetical protein